MDPYLAVERPKHHEAAVAPEATSPAPEASGKEKMRAKLRSASGKALRLNRSIRDIDTCSVISANTNFPTP